MGDRSQASALLPSAGEGRSTTVIPKPPRQDMGEGTSAMGLKTGGGLAVMIGNKKVNLKNVSGRPGVSLVNKSPAGMTRGESSGVSSMTLSDGVPVRLVPVEDMQEEYVSPQVIMLIMAQRVLVNKSPATRGESSGVSSITLSGGVPVHLAPVEDMQEEHVSPQVIMAQRILADLHPTNPNAPPPDEEGEVVCCFDSSDDLASHEPSCAGGETDTGSLTCHCGKEFSNSDALAAHQHTHETGEVADFVCHHCGKSFDTESNLEIHETVHLHTVRKPFRCAYCNKGFLEEEDLTSHEGEHTGESKKRFQCSICTKYFARNTSYNNHLKEHATGRRFFCSFCDKSYPTEQEMLDHQQRCLAQMVARKHGKPVPTGKRYKCSVCGIRFQRKVDLKNHERVHTGERPYSCDQCDKSFARLDNLNVHKLIHTGVRPFVCKICDKAFRQKSTLNRHEINKHTNVGSQLEMSSNAAFMTPVYTGGADQAEGLVVDAVDSD